MDKNISGDELSRVIGSLMADEKFGEILASVKGSLSANAEDPPAQDIAAESAESSATDDKDPPAEPASAPIPAIPQLSPELLSKLPEIMSMLSAGGEKRKGDSRMADRTKLLHALKPFLSDRRREAVDSIVSIAGIADLFGL